MPIALTSEIAAAMRGEHGAVASLYDRHAPRLYALALHLTGDAELAANAVERAFQQLLLGPAPQTSRSVEVRLIGLTSQHARDLARDHAADHVADAVQPAGDGALIPRSLAAACYLHGQSVASLARIHDRSETDIRQLLQQGMVALRAELAEREWG